MKVLSVRFVLSAASGGDLPRDALPQLALVGRSNVGKSSLINALVRRRVARTSGAPGKTRLLNFYAVELAAGDPKRLYLVDLPGYGYTRGGATAAAEFDRLASAYFSRQPAARGALLMVDARHPGLPQDVAAWQWLATQAAAPAVVVTKIDKLSRAARLRALDVWQTSLNVPVTPVSAATGEGLENLWLLIVRLLNRRRPPSATATGATPT